MERVRQYMIKRQIERWCCDSVSFLRVIVSFALLLSVVACNAPGPECVLADDWGDKEERAIYINPQKEWMSANLKVAYDEPLYIKTTGALDTCPVSRHYDQYDIKSNEKAWQNTGLWINEGDPIGMFIDESTSYSSLNGMQYHGQGLYAYIGETAPSNDDFWYGDSGISVNGGSANKYVSTDPQFFEMYDNGSVGAGASGFSGLAPRDGYIWFKYARSPDARNVVTSGNFGERQSPWRGEYQWHSTWCPSCDTAAALFFACGGWGNLICAATAGVAYGICTGEGYTWPNNLHCLEHFGDHWVEEEYSLNSGGYRVTISRGCIGLNGNYLQMIVADEDHIVQVGEDPITEMDGTPRLSPDGVPLTKPVYAVEIPDGDSRILNLDPDSADSSVDQFGLYNDHVPANGELWFHFVDSNTNGQGDGNYLNNVGSYRVYVKTTRVDTGFSDFINTFVHPIEDLMRGVCKTSRTLPQELCPVAEWKIGLAERLYKQFLGVGGKANTFVASLRLVLVLYIILYGLSYMLGMISDTQKDFVGRVIRFAIVQQLLSPASWEFFNVYLFRAFTFGLDELIVLLTGQFAGVVGTALTDPITGDPIVDSEGNQIIAGVMDKFAFANQTMSFFFREETMIKISALIFTSKVYLINPFGIVLAILIFVGIFLYSTAVLKAAVIYLLALISISLLLIVSPLAIAFMLFAYTRDTFKGWLMQLMNFALQPTLVLTAMAIFNIFVYSALYNTLRYDVCWQCVWELSIDIIPGFGSIDVCLFKFYLPWGIQDSLSYTPVSLFTVLIFIIIVHAMLSFNDWMTKLAAQITSGLQGTALAEQASKVANSGISAAFMVAKMGAKTGKKAASAATSGAAGAASRGQSLMDKGTETSE